MKKVSNYYMICLWAALGCFWSCTDDTSGYAPEENRLAVQLGGVIGSDSGSRATDEGFCDGDRMGIYVVDYINGQAGTLQLEGNRATNVGYTYSAGTNVWTPDYEVYYKDAKTPVDIYGYYPYATPNAVDTYSFEVRTDQHISATSSKLGGYEASDFLWAKTTKVTPTDEVVKLSFSHRLSGVRVSLQMGSGFTADEWNELEKTVQLLNTRTSAEIDLSTGIAMAVGEVNPMGIVAAKDGEDFRAIVVPQTISAGMPLLGITVGGVNYSYTLSSAIAYTAGKLHSYAMRVDKKSPEGDYAFTLLSESVTAWEEDGVSHDVTAREYVVVDCKAGQLEQCLTEAGKDYAKVQCMKLTGTMDASDFFFMRDKMTDLMALNLKEVRIVASTTDASYRAKMIPRQALYQKDLLVSFIFPDELEEIGERAFAKTSLSGSLTIPEGTKRIGERAFWDCQKLVGKLSLPITLERIDAHAFANSAFMSELLLPGKLTYIGDNAFYDCKNLKGGLTLPKGLTYLGGSAFTNCPFIGSLIIPHSITEIQWYTFSGCKFDGTLTLHEGLKKIGDSAFSGNKFSGELELPESLKEIGKQAFYNCYRLSGTLRLPSKLTIIKEGAFSGCSQLTDELAIPEGVLSIGKNAFANCTMIQKLVIPQSVDLIQESAFYMCTGLQSIVCKSEYPPFLQNGVFDGVSKTNFYVEVPEATVISYKTTAGWSEFKNIGSHHELNCRPSFACALTEEHTEEWVIDAEGEWEVKEKPDWCDIAPSSGNGKTLVEITIHKLPDGSANREDEVVFELTGKGYTTTCKVQQYAYRYKEDEIITLQQHTEGNGVNVVFVGDGYNAASIADGSYLMDINKQVEHFFGLPPFSTYRNYFNVYTGIALSQEEGVGTVNTTRYNRFGTTFTNATGMQGDYDAIFEYACKAPTVDEKNLKQTLIVVVPNSTSYGGQTHIWNDGATISFCPMSSASYPYDTRGVLQHEACGHGFGKLGDELIAVNQFIDLCDCGSPDHLKVLQDFHTFGFYKNLSLTGKMNEVPWSHMIFHEKYSGLVDVFEGGYYHSRGVFRAEQNSCMNNKVPYFNAYSRELIVKRIMEYAGETYSFEKFVEKDDTNPGSRSEMYYDVPWKDFENHYAPVIHY